MYYTSQAYPKFNRYAIADEIKKEGFDPILITDKPGYIYPPHEHAEAKLLVILEGTMQVTVNSQRFQCVAGDKIFIPGNTPHSAIVGNQGCTFFWSEKIL